MKDLRSQSIQFTYKQINHMINCFFHFLIQKLMLKDYLNRLALLQDDRSKFEKQKQKINHGNKMNKQETIYQAYIIEQMNDRNKLIAAVTIQQAVFKQVYNQSYFSFKTISQVGSQEIVQSSKGRYAQKEGLGQNIISISKEKTFIAKMCSKIMVSILQKVIISNSKVLFNKLKKCSKIQKIISKMIKVTTKYYLKASIYAISHQITNFNSNLFDESISIIDKNSRIKYRTFSNQEESDLNGLIEKSTNDCPLCVQSQYIISQQQEEIFKYQEELSFIRKIAQTPQSQNGQCQNIRITETLYHHNQGYSQSYSNSSSFNDGKQRFPQIEKRIKNIHSRISVLSQSSNNSEEASMGLLGKYMKQSFKMRESIEIARGQCIQLKNKLKNDLKQQISNIIKVLTVNEEKNEDQSEAEQL